MSNTLKRVTNADLVISWEDDEKTYEFKGRVDTATLDVGTDHQEMDAGWGVAKLWLDKTEARWDIKLATDDSGKYGKFIEKMKPTTEPEEIAERSYSVLRTAELTVDQLTLENVQSAARAAGVPPMTPFAVTSLHKPELVLWNGSESATLRFQWTEEVWIDG